MMTMMRRMMTTTTTVADAFDDFARTREKTSRRFATQRWLCCARQAGRDDYSNNVVVVVVVVVVRRFGVPAIRQRAAGIEKAVGGAVGGVAQLIDLRTSRTKTTRRESSMSSIAIPAQLPGVKNVGVFDTNIPHILREKKRRWRRWIEIKEARERRRVDDQAARELAMQIENDRNRFSSRYGRYHAQLIGGATRGVKSKV